MTKTPFFEGTGEIEAVTTLVQMRESIAKAISRFRDRRRTFRRSVEQIFDRQTFVTLLVLGPLGKAIELSIVGQPGHAARFGAMAIAGLLMGIYWARLAEAASEMGDKVEEAVDPDE